MNFSQGSSIGRAPGLNPPKESAGNQRGRMLSEVRNSADVVGSQENCGDNGVQDMHEVGGSSPSPATTFKPFQIRWNEPMGKPECPYMFRWVLNLGPISIRLHHWLRSDDKRYFHDHPWNFVALILKGSYTDVSPDGGRDTVKAGSIRFREATHRHYVDVPKGGCWSLLLCGPKLRNWGFYVNGKFYRPLRFFSRHGHPPCHEQ